MGRQNPSLIDWVSIADEEKSHGVLPSDEEHDQAGSIDKLTINSTELGYKSYKPSSRASRYYGRELNTKLPQYPNEMPGLLTTRVIQSFQVIDSSRLAPKTTSRRTTVESSRRRSSRQQCLSDSEQEPVLCR